MAGTDTKIGRPKEFARRIPGVHITAEQDLAIQELQGEYGSTYADALRFLLNTGIKACRREAAPH